HRRIEDAETGLANLDRARRLQNASHGAWNIGKDDRVFVEQQPVLRTWKATSQISDVRPAAASEIDHFQRSIARQRIAGDPHELRGASRCIERLAQRQPVTKRRPLHPPNRSSAIAIWSTASSHVGKRSRTRRAPAEKRSRRLESSMMRASAPLSALTSAGGTTRPASAATRSTTAPVADATTGRPRARASATTMPYVSRNDG